MIETIRIGHLLRETAATPYRNLITRPTGAAVRDRIEAALAESGCGTALLDFSDIELLDFSCADEVVAKLMLAERSGRVLVLLGLREDQHEAIEQVLIHHGLALVTVSSANGEAMPELIGWVTADDRAAFGCLCARGPLRPFQLARSLDWSEARTLDALFALLTHRLVRAEGELYFPIAIA
jgi:anti-anti-sigma regulatory factor